MDCNRLKYIDVLKAFAIMAVVLYHSGFMAYGYLGVELFFVISGFLTTKSLWNRVVANTSSGESVAGCKSYYFEFELNRIVRLLPILLMAGIISMSLGFWLMLPDDYENLSESVVATNLFGNNILAAITTKDYWDVVNEYKPLMHTWYVGVLMQFYIVYPILFFLARLDKKNPKRTLIVMLSALVVASLAVYFVTDDVAKRFYYLPSRLFEFGVGGIAALVYTPKAAKLSHKCFAYVCYALLLALMLVNREIIPASVRLVAVVALSVVLVVSGSSLENKVAANRVFAKLGAASFSIFVWHQVVLAFYRYSISNRFTIWGYAALLAVVALLSWLTYHFVEQKTGKWLQEKKSKRAFYAITVGAFIVLTCFAGYMYWRGGVVRDVPELYISKSEQVDHKAYNDRVYQMDKPFETDKRHWLVVGNSFGRDFANVILESPVSDCVEVSYIYGEKYKNAKYMERFSSADRVFLSSMGTDEKDVEEMEQVCKSAGFNVDNLVIVGTKNFGESNGQFYAKRHRPDYFMQRTEIAPEYVERNERLKALYGDRYLDLIGLVKDEKGTMPVFTPDHHFVSQDCRHFSKGGTIWFGQLIDWEKYL